jgi:hypothetical protein
MIKIKDYKVSNLLLSIRIEDSDYGAPVVSYNNDGFWTLIYTYPVYDPVKEEWVVIKAGFVFDLASVPRVAWWACAPFELSIVAPLAHDWLYAGKLGGYTRKEADDFFLYLMKREGVPRWRRYIAYHAVRLFGKKHWRGEHA